jgi:hypothetical protein
MHVVATVIEKFENFHDSSSVHVCEIATHMLHSLCGSSVVSAQLAKVPSRSTAQCSEA